MRTTIELSDELVGQAREILGGPSLRAMIEKSLREAIRARSREKLLRAIGNFDLTIDERDLDEIRRDRLLE